MRVLILVAGASLLISACGAENDAGNAVATTDNLAAEAIIANDTTAIDAATGDAANMAADVDYSVNLMDNQGGDIAAGGGTISSRRRPSQQPADVDTNGAAPDETAVDSNGV